MIPTERDNELDEIVDKYIYDIAVLRPYTRVTKEAKRSLIQLITADRKRVALEARIDEATRGLSLSGKYEHRQYFTGRIAELKAQLEEL